MNVSVQCVAYKEPDLHSTLDQWAEQRVPDGFSVSYEAWVTPSKEPREACSTWRQAADHDTFEVFDAPQYKLRARNAAHSAAVEGGQDAFVTVDADAPPLAPDTLSKLLTTLSRPSVACACANPVAPTDPIGLWSNLGVYAKELAVGGIHGQCHGVTAEAWQHAGPFTDDVNHTELKSVWMEEEYDFGRRLREVGDVVYEYDAPVRNDTRRRVCAWRRKLPGKELGGYCDKPQGDSTFAPRRPR